MLSEKLKKDLAFRLVLDGLSRGLDELLHGVDPAHPLLEDGAVLDNIVLGLLQLVLANGCEVCVQPKSTDRLVLEVKFRQVDRP